MQNLKDQFKRRLTTPKPALALHEAVYHRLLKRPHVLHTGFDEGATAKDARVTIVMLHGLGRNAMMWQQIADQLCARDSSLRVIAIDLLGFGASPKPAWQKYNATNQAKSLQATLKKLGVRGPKIIVGHSLGALVAAEYAALYPKNIMRVFLLSAPIFRDVPEKLFEKIPRRQFRENFYKRVMRDLRARQQVAQNLNLYGRKLKVFAPDFVVDEKNLLGTMRSVEMAIENQGAFDHIKTSPLPMLLMYGRLDPFVIKSHYKALTRANKNVSMTSVLAGHELAENRNFSRHLVKKILQVVDENAPTT